MTTHLGVLPLDIVELLRNDFQNDLLGFEGGLSLIRLPHPRTGTPCLFLFSAIRNMLLEVQAVSPTDTRSWFLSGEAISNGKLLLITPLDPVFLLIPILQAVYPNIGSSEAFRPIDDIFEIAAMKLQSINGTAEGEFRNDVIQFSSLNCVKNSINSICDKKEISTELKVYRLSHKKITEYLNIKVSRLAATEVLGNSCTIMRGFAKDGLMDDGKQELLTVAHTRAACDLLAQYLPPELRIALLGTYNFTDLEAYLKKEGNASANADRSTTVEGKAAVVEGKKRKNAKDSSGGVAKLKKVNVTGMAKLTSLFKKVV